MFFFGKSMIFCHKFMDKFHKKSSIHPVLYRPISIDFQLVSVGIYHSHSIVFKPHHHLVGQTDLLRILRHIFSLYPLSAGQFLLVHTDVTGVCCRLIHLHSRIPATDRSQSPRAGICSSGYSSPAGPLPP